MEQKGCSSYEEWKKASEFAKFRYKCGLVVTILSWICLVLLLIFVVYYGKELATHPMKYTASKYNLECTCFDFQDNVIWYFNSTHAEYKKEGVMINPYLEK